MLYQLEVEARAFAADKHGSILHVRKYTQQPYIMHPEAVVQIVKSVPHTPEMLAAAWLHDTVEDTDATIYEIEFLFGKEVASLVADLTDVSKPEDGNRKARKEIDRLHTANASPDAKTIKLADLLDNTKDILQNDPDFAKVYFHEKAALLQVLTEGDTVLWQKANWFVQDYLK